MPVLLFELRDWQTANLLCSNSVMDLTINNISLCDSTVVTKENLHLKENSRLTTKSMSNENEN